MKWITVFSVLLFLSCSTAKESETETKEGWLHLEGNAQGTTFSIKYHDEKARDFSKEIKNIFDKMDQQLSTYVDTSLISRINGSDDTLRILSDSDIYFHEVFGKAKEIYTNTEGAFNPLVFSLVQYWGFGKKAETPEVIDSLVIDTLLFDLRFEDVVYQKDKPVLSCSRDVKFDFNGIAQGYTVDVIAEFLELQGIKNFMIEVGGEVRAKGKNDRDTWWQLGIDKPIDINEQHELQAIIQLQNRSMATSGSYRKFYEKDGVRYSHTIDPFTGYPVQHSLLSATVLADDCASADAYATAFMVMGVEKGKEFLKKHPELRLDVYFIYSDKKGNFKTWYSEGIEKIIDEEV